MKLKVDEVFDTNTNISNKNIFFDQDQATIKKWFLQMQDKIIYKKITEKAIIKALKLFLHFSKQINLNEKLNSAV